MVKCKTFRDNSQDRLDNKMNKWLSQKRLSRNDIINISMSQEESSISQSGNSLVGNKSIMVICVVIFYNETKLEPIESAIELDDNGDLVNEIH